MNSEKLTVNSISEKYNEAGFLSQPLCLGRCGMDESSPLTSNCQVRGLSMIRSGGVRKGRRRMLMVGIGLGSGRVSLPFVPRLRYM